MKKLMILVCLFFSTSLLCMKVVPKINNFKGHQTIHHTILSPIKFNKSVIANNEIRHNKECNLQQVIYAIENYDVKHFTESINKKNKMTAEKVLKEHLSHHKIIASDILIPIGLGVAGVSSIALSGPLFFCSWEFAHEMGRGENIFHYSLVIPSIAFGYVGFIGCWVAGSFALINSFLGAGYLIDKSINRTRLKKMQTILNKESYISAKAGK